ncbi:hypothetical protein [Actinacidiphila glaucinigra]|uniref:Uncharacterized protein n=1 Tax=Actinacidiphila glaucinigra TaxID=235986 RepID=A0A239NXI1_9ACTN|nr:hypothetical protein [Actinacidiphila glaucinigra]SNT59153.1 hypothetical protein SAMN05216252_15326 [Actinacidiphila glaucinigra]
MSVTRAALATTATATVAIALLTPAAAYATPVDSPLKLTLSDISHNEVARGRTSRRSP